MARTAQEIGEELIAAIKVLIAELNRLMDDSGTFELILVTTNEKGERNRQLLK